MATAAFQRIAHRGASAERLENTLSAFKLAMDRGLALEPEAYFVTEHQVDVFIKTRDKAEFQHQLEQKIHGTTGVVAIDKHGNLASGTSSSIMNAHKSSLAGILQGFH